MEVPGPEQVSLLVGFVLHANAVLQLWSLHWRPLIQSSWFWGAADPEMNPGGALALRSTVRISCSSSRALIGVHVWPQQGLFLHRFLTFASNFIPQTNNEKQP